VGLTIPGEVEFMTRERRLMVGVIVSVFFLLLLAGCDQPYLSGIETDKIDLTRDPVQTLCRSESPIVKEIKDGAFTLTPVAEYNISGVVVSKKRYREGWEGEISPIDLAIVWGKLAEPGHGRDITFWQSQRWYFFKYGAGSRLDQSTIATHSANQHMIPATLNVRKALLSIRKNDQVVLKGFLVNLKGTYKKKAVFWNTSLSRNDTGQNSCELFYVSRVRTDTKVYE
jgi:hypothetical protein